jgi:TonB-linked SusC/RagA family outer membrane protein
MKKNHFSIFSLWKKYKIFLYLNLTIILVLSLTTDLAVAGSIGGISILDNLQKITVKGKVTDVTSREALPGVNIVVKGTTLGVMTDVTGNYTLEVPDASATLVYSFIGYVTQEIVLAGRSTLDVAMAYESTQLTEVVVVGYGTQLKKDVTGSVSSVSSARLLDRPAFDIGQAIGGKIAGVKVIERSGAPGGNAMIRIRGTNSINSSNDPLFVVDGIVGVSNAMSILNPNEIQTMDVLKDASATAIYGARGANGVIIITTKRGVAGKTQVEYNVYVSRGVSKRHFYVLNAEQMMYVTKQAWMNVGKYATSPNWPACFDANILTDAGVSLTGQKTYSDMTYLFEQTTAGGYPIPLVGADGNYYKPRFDTNWESLTFVPETSTNHQINIRGGTEKAKFGTFFNYALENGLLLNSYFSRYSGKLNGDVKVNDWLTVSTNLGVNKNRNRTNDVSYFSGGIARAAVEAYSILPVKYPDDPEIYGAFAGQWSSNADFPAGETPHTPVSISAMTEAIADRTQVTGDITLNFNITHDLSLKSNFSVDGSNYKYNNYSGRQIDSGNQGSTTINIQNTFYWQNENYFNYLKTIGDHSITGLLGISW